MTAEWARHYVAQGFSVVPLHHPTGDRCSCGRYPCGKNNRSAGKHPTHVGWQAAPVMTAEQAARIWAAEPRTNIGLRMGGETRHVAIDIDGAIGRASLALLERELGALPPTMITKSGRADGGEHRIFRVPEPLDVDAISNSSSALAPGIDVKCSRGQVVAPPSLHYEGKRYEAIDVRPPADLPVAWYERLPKHVEPASTGSPTEQASAYLAKIPPAIEGEISEGGKYTGGTHTFATCVKIVRGFDLTEAEAFTVITPWNARCSPPWSEHDLRRKIHEAAEKGDMPRGALLVKTNLTFEVLEAADIFAPLPDVIYLVQGIGITQGAPMLIAGYGYSGKTAAVQQLAIDLAREQAPGEWMNPRPVWGMWPATKRAKVLHVDYEQGHRLTRRRYQRIAKAAGVDPRELEGWLKLVSLPELYLNTAIGKAALERLCEGIDLVIVDSFRAANPGLEENSSDAREPLDALNRISEKQGCASVVIHHARKPNKDAPGGAKMSIRGSGAIFDGSASVLVFEGEKDEPKNVSHEKERNSGITVDNFDLEIVDENGGLVVRAKDIVLKSKEEIANEQIEADKELIRKHLTVKMFFTNRDEIRAAMCVTPARAGAAMGAMLSSGELVQSGSYHNRTYHLSGAVPVNGTAR